MSADALIGSTIGGCMILEILGQGGMGVIYKARQKSLDRIVALKVLAPHLANDINFVCRFQREARAIARVNHPNILAVYDVGDDQNTNYMIMELIDGRSLAELQNERRGALPWEEAADFVRQSAEGLEAAQAAGIIHRDIKPENLMVTKKGVIKVSDFGLAKETDASNTSVDAVMGTPAFMSPEQCDGKKVDGRSDIYSLGGTFYRLITGRLPFDAETAMSMMYRHKHEALVPPEEIAPGIPKSVSAVIVKMMAKKREHRYQTMTEVIEAIADARKGANAHLTPIPSAQSVVIPEIPPVSAGPTFTDLPPMPASRDSAMYTRAAMPPPPPPAAQSQQVSAVPMHSFAAPKDSSRLSRPTGIIGPGSSSPEDGPGAIARAEDLLSRGERLAALKMFRQALQLGGLDNQGRNRAEEEIRKEVAARKQGAENLVKRGMLLEASREFRILIELDPMDQTLRAAAKDLETKLAQKRTVVNDIRTAIAASTFEKAIKIWDSTPLELREEALGKQIEGLRNDIVPSFKLAEQGDNLARQGRLEEAMSSYEDALKINPACEPARIGLKETEVKIQKIEFMLKEGFQHSLEQNYLKAVETWKPILTLRPGHPQAVKGVVDAYTAQAQQMRAHGDLEGALEALKGAMETDPQNRAVRRAVEDLTNLRDKEQALIDRAQDAVARRNLGKAIGYWKEAQKVNPSSKRAAQQLAQLGQQQSRKWLVVLLVTLLAAGAAGTAYKYYSEMNTLQSVDEVMHMRPLVDNDHLVSAIPPENTLRENAEKLEKASFIFMRDESREMLDHVHTQIKIEKTRKMELSGQFADAAAEYESILRGMKDKQLAKVLLAHELLCKVKRLRASAEEAVAEHKWEKANDDWSDIVAILEKRASSNAELDAAAPYAEKAVSLVQKIIGGLGENKADGKQKAFSSAKKLLEGLNFPGLDAYLDQQINGLGFDQKKFQESMELGIKALKAIPPDLKHAEDSFRAAKGYNRTDISVDMFIQYTADMATCKSRNMSLYAADTPLKQATWGSHERRVAFCVDRYEWPNVENQIPRSNVSWLEASSLCKSKGKLLCTTQQWSDACKGDDATKQFPYGKAPDPAACNTAGPNVMPSGAKSGCKNALGLFDMSGNLAEWADSNDPANPEAPIMGGSFSTPANQAGCDDSMNAKKSAATGNIGFRCCQSLGDIQTP